MKYMEGTVQMKKCIMFTTINNVRFTRNKNTYKREYDKTEFLN